MMRAWLSIALSLGLVGCTGDDDSPGAEDSGTFVPADAGIPPRRDAGPGMTGDGGEARVCFEFDPVAMDDLPRCRAATLGCVTGCADDDDACRDACYAADTFPPGLDNPSDPFTCNDCVFQQAITCVEENGCGNEVAAFFCCIVDNCFGGDPCDFDQCLADNCQTAAETMFGCAIATAPECFDVSGGPANSCFDSMDPDAGMAGDAGVPDAGMEMCP